MNKPAEAPRTVSAKKEPNKFKRLFRVLGPGLITGASDDDPSGIGTYAQSGAKFGYSMLWMALVSYPLMLTVQYICAKIGLVTGEGLASILRKHYPRWVVLSSVLVLLVANTINAGADIGAIAAAVNLLVPAIPIKVAIVPISLILVAIIVIGSYERVVSIFKWLTFSLFAYVAAAFFAKADWGQVLHSTFIPTLKADSDFVAMIVAILGTTISPYLFFWQITNEVEEQRKEGRSLSERQGATKADLKYAAIDVNAGMFVSNLVMYFIILTTAATLHVNGKFNISSAQEAAMALRPLAGDAATLLFAIGLIGTGFLAVPILTSSAAFALSEAFGWRRGLDEKWYRAPHFYSIILVSTILGMALNFSSINPMQALYWTAVLNGILAPPLLTILMLVSGNKKIMGDKVNSGLVSIVGWATTIIMYVAAVAFFWTSLTK